MDDDRFILALGGGVFLVWGASMFAEIVTGGAYQTPLAVHGMMGTIVGTVFTERRLRQNSRKRARRARASRPKKGVEK